MPYLLFHFFSSESVSSRSCAKNDGFIVLEYIEFYTDNNAWSDPFHVEPVGILKFNRGRLRNDGPVDAENVSVWAVISNGSSSWVLNMENAPFDVPAGSTYKPLELEKFNLEDAGISPGAYNISFMCHLSFPNGSDWEGTIFIEVVHWGSSHCWCDVDVNSTSIEMIVESYTQYTVDVRGDDAPEVHISYKGHESITVHVNISGRWVYKAEYFTFDDCEGVLALLTGLPLAIGLPFFTDYLLSKKRRKRSIVISIFLLLFFSLFLLSYVIIRIKTSWGSIFVRCYVAEIRFDEEVTIEGNSSIDISPEWEEAGSFDIRPGVWDFLEISFSDDRTDISDIVDIPRELWWEVCVDGETIASVKKGVLLSLSEIHVKDPHLMALLYAELTIVIVIWAISLVGFMRLRPVFKEAERMTRTHQIRSEEQDHLDIIEKMYDAFEVLSFFPPAMGLFIFYLILLSVIFPPDSSSTQLVVQEGFVNLWAEVPMLLGLFSLLMITLIALRDVKRIVTKEPAEAT